jgi:hypothetical protein
MLFSFSFSTYVRANANAKARRRHRHQDAACSPVRACCPGWLHAEVGASEGVRSYVGEHAYSTVHSTSRYVRTSCDWVGGNFAQVCLAVHT